MVFAPDDGTIRGHVSHILIMTLLIWLLQDITKVYLNTTLVDHFFLFSILHLYVGLFVTFSI